MGAFGSRLRVEKRPQESRKNCPAGPKAYPVPKLPMPQSTTRTTPSTARSAAPTRTTRTQAVQVLERWNTWVRVRFAGRDQEAWINLEETPYRSMGASNPSSEAGPLRPASPSPRSIDDPKFSEKAHPSQSTPSDAGA